MAQQIVQDALISVQGVKKSFKKNDRQDLLVLDDLNFSLGEGEIIALLGKSGSGKSTLLRIIAGLTQPTVGQVLYRGQPIRGPVKGLSMVFQNFALFPWLTVLQNVELGLEAQGVAKAERRRRALQAIDIIGMDGFESAYPKELSGGMCQRIGFARALVVDPEILLMDEPFSALDVLTAENLRSDLLDLWQSGKTNIKSILFVTHNIEEAALLADRVLIFGSDPGCILSEIEIKMPHPRNEQEEVFRTLVDDIYTQMTTSTPETAGAALTIEGTEITLQHRLPKAEISGITGLLETLQSSEYESMQKVDLPKVAEVLHLDIDDLFPITEALEILEFAKVSEGDIEITDIGKRFVAVDILQRKKLFAKQLLAHVPLARYIRFVLDRRMSHRISEEHFLRELGQLLSEEAATEVLKVAIDWGRYAELFAYDFNTKKLSLENPGS